MNRWVSNHGVPSFTLLRTPLVAIARPCEGCDSIPSRTRSIQYPVIRLLNKVECVVRVRRFMPFRANDPCLADQFFGWTDKLNTDRSICKKCDTIRAQETAATNIFGGCQEREHNSQFDGNVSFAGTMKIRSVSRYLPTMRSNDWQVDTMAACVLVCVNPWPIPFRLQPRALYRHPARLFARSAFHTPSSSQCRNHTAACQWLRTATSL